MFPYIVKWYFYELIHVPSMLTFLLAVSYLCFFHTNPTTSSITGASFVILSAVIVLVMWMGWGESARAVGSDEVESSFLVALWDRLRSRLKYISPSTKVHKCRRPLARFVGAIRRKQTNDSEV